MSFEFVISDFGPQKVIDGEYIGTFRHTEIKNDLKYGVSVIVEREIDAPEKFIGNIHAERFQIGSPNEVQRSIATKRLSALLHNMLNVQVGDRFNEEKLLSLLSSLINRKCRFTLKTNDKGYQNVTLCEPYSDYQFPIETGIKAPESMSYGKSQIPLSSELNDDVPF